MINGISQPAIAGKTGWPRPQPRRTKPIRKSPKLLIHGTSQKVIAGKSRRPRPLPRRCHPSASPGAQKGNATSPTCNGGLTPQPNRLRKILSPHPPSYKMFNGTSTECPRPLITAERPPIAEINESIPNGLMGLPSRSHPCDPAVAHQASRIMAGLVRYRGDATHLPNPGTQNSTDFANQTQRRTVGGFVR